MGKEDPGNLAERWKEGAFLAQKKGEMAPWASSNPQAFPTTSFTHVRPSRASRGGCLQAHTSPLAVASQTKQQQETSIKFKREIAVTSVQHIHTCLPPLHTPPPGKGSREPLLQGSPYSNPIRVPRVIHSSHAACGCSRGEEHSPSLVAGETSLCWAPAGGAAPGPKSRARPASALDPWLPMRMCRNEWAVCNGQGDEEEVRGGGRAPRYTSTASTPPVASLGRHRLDGEQAAELKVLDHRKLLQALQERR